MNRLRLLALVAAALFALIATWTMARAQSPKTGYFPEEEEHIAAYLNLRYYHFKD